MKKSNIFINEIDEPRAKPQKIEDFIVGIGKERFESFKIKDKWLPIKENLIEKFEDFYKNNKQEVEEYYDKFWKNNF